MFRFLLLLEVINLTNFQINYFTAFAARPPFFHLLLFHFSLSQVMASLFLAWRILPGLYGGVVVVRLPFQPPGFFLKATHRGLEGADPREGSAVSFKGIDSLFTG